MPFFFWCLVLIVDNCDSSALHSEKMLSLLLSYIFFFCIAYYAALSNRI